MAEELEEGDRVGEVPGVRVELGAPRAVDAAGGDAQRAGPRHLRRPRNDAVAVVVVRPPLAVGEVEALHICDGEEEKRIAERERDVKRRVKGEGLGAETGFFWINYNN